MGCPPPPRRWRPPGLDVTLAVGFAGLDTVLPLGGVSWWPRPPATLAWTLLVIQALACLTLAAQRRAPLTVLITPAHLLEPQNGDNVWAPYATILAAYAPILGASSPWRAFVAVRGLPSARSTQIGLLAHEAGLAEP